MLSAWAKYLNILGGMFLMNIIATDRIVKICMMGLSLFL